MTDWDKPEELKEATPRRVRRTFKTWLTIVAGLVLLSFSFIFCCLLDKHYLEIERLKKYGVQTSAFVTECKTHRAPKYHKLVIKYIFDIKSIDLAPNALKSYAGSQEISPIFESVFCKESSVIIIYDPKSPRISQMVLPDGQKTIGYYFRAAWSILVLTSFLGMGLHLSLVVFCRSHRERRILRIGRLAFTELSHPVPKKWALGDYKSVVRYRFKDSSGQITQGSSRILDTSGVTSLEPFYRKTVIFDPSDSRKSLLYPPRYCEVK